MKTLALMALGFVVSCVIGAASLALFNFLWDRNPFGVFNKAKHDEK